MSLQKFYTNSAYPEKYRILVKLRYDGLPSPEIEQFVLGAQQIVLTLRIGLTQYTPLFDMFMKMARLVFVYEGDSAYLDYEQFVFDSVLDLVVNGASITVNTELAKY